MAKSRRDEYGTNIWMMVWWHEDSCKVRLTCAYIFIRNTTEAEYNALSTSLREVIHLMQLIDEAKSKGWKTVDEAPKIHCKVFEDNIGALAMASLPKMRPRTKHLCIRLDHFREKV
jgi:hypothetical protein